MTRRATHLKGMATGTLAIMVLDAHAAISEFQEAAAAHPALMHQYTFDGSDDSARMADQKGRAHLAPNAFGTGSPTDLAFGEPGFDESSEAVRTSREIGSDHTGGAALKNPAISLGQAVSFEAIFQPSQEEITGGSFNLGYIVSTRVGNDRGYFLVQGDAPLPSEGTQLSSTMGNGFNSSNQNLLLDQVVPGHWYYAAGSYRIEGGRVTMTNYLADLTAGQTTLTEIGPFTNSGGTYPTTSTTLGIGGRWDAGEAFPGLIDEVNLYDAALTASDFQSHLSLILGADLSLTVTADGEELTFTWKSKPGKKYNLRSSTALSSAPAEWPVYGDREGLEATPPLNSLTIPFPAEGKRLFVIEEFTPPPLVVFSDDFEDGQGAWLTGSSGALGTSWEIGMPGNPGPASANSGSNCAGTNLESDYALDADVWLRSPIIDLTTATGATLSYAQVIDVEVGFDSGTIRALDADDESELAVIADMIDGVSTEWKSVSRRLPEEVLARRIIIEFRFNSDDLNVFPGWYLDDVEVTVP